MPQQSMRLNIERRVRDEESGLGGSTRSDLPNGVLSSLLTLYNNQPRTVYSNPASQDSTAVTTPVGEHSGGGDFPFVRPGNEWSGAAVAKQDQLEPQLSTYVATYIQE